MCGRRVCSRGWQRAYGEWCSWDSSRCAGVVCAHGGGKGRATGRCAGGAHTRRPQVSSRGVVCAVAKGQARCRPWLVVRLKSGFPAEHEVIRGITVEGYAARVWEGVRETARHACGRYYIRRRARDVELGRKTPPVWARKAWASRVAGIARADRMWPRAHASRGLPHAGLTEQSKYRLRVSASRREGAGSGCGASKVPQGRRKGVAGAPQGRRKGAATCRKAVGRSRG